MTEQCTRLHLTCPNFFGQASRTNRPLARSLCGLETGHPAVAGSSPAWDFSVFDKQKAVFLVFVLDCSECDSSGLDHPNSSWSNARLKDYLKKKRPQVNGMQESPAVLPATCIYVVAPYTHRMYISHGSRSAPTNYRPIALLSVVSKVLEKIVHRRLSMFLQPILSSKQSGFRKRDSAEYQLTRLVQQWSNAMDKSQFVGVIFLDIKKAFDGVYLPGLLYKLESAGVRGRALQWFRNFLQNRCQRTMIGQSFSSVEYLHAGVPQGACDLEPSPVFTVHE